MRETGNAEPPLWCQNGRRSTLASAPRLPLRFWAALALFGVACASMKYTEILRPPEEIRRVMIDSEVGDLRVQNGPSLEVRREIRGLEAALNLSERIEGDTLTLTARCLPLLPCGVDLNLSVPEGVDVVARVGRGDVVASGLDRLELDLGAGAADLSVREALVARVGQGSLSASAPASATVRGAVADGDATLETAPGERPLRLSARQVELQGVAAAERGGGAVELVAPAGTARVIGVTTLADR